MPQFRPPQTPASRPQQGAALASTLIVILVLAAIMLAYATLSMKETRTSSLSTGSQRGFYVAEGGLNQRAALLKQAFNGYGLPSGSGPSSAAPCTGTDQGSGSLACLNFAYSGRTARTYVINATQNVSGGDPGIVEAGSPFAGLNFQQFSYKAYSMAVNAKNDTEAKLKMEFQSRLIPLFQFAVFYAGDLEMMPGSYFVMNGRVHTNGNFYLAPHGGTRFFSSGVTAITAAGTFYASPKRTSSGCDTNGYQYGDVQVNTKPWGACQMAHQPLTTTELSTLNPAAISHVAPLYTPPLSSLGRTPSSDLWSYADVRIVAHRVGNSTVLEVRNADNSINVTSTLSLAACTLGSAPPITLSTSFYDRFENKTLTLMDVDQVNLMDCLYARPFVRDDGSAVKLDASAHNGLAIHLSFDDASSGLSSSGEGVRLRNGARLGSSLTGAPAIKGLSVITDQSLYLQGDYNTVNKVPAAIMADSVNVLSNVWKDSSKPGSSSSLPIAANTTYNVACLSGTRITVPDSVYSGGLETYLRPHEDWRGQTMTYRGSFVSLGLSLHSQSPWVYGTNYYEAPIRNFDYDSSFDNAQALPPLTPRVVYLRQLLFSRSFE